MDLISAIQALGAGDAHCQEEERQPYHRLGGYGVVGQGLEFRLPTVPSQQPRPLQGPLEGLRQIATMGDPEYWPTRLPTLGCWWSSTYGCRLLKPDLSHPVPLHMTSPNWVIRPDKLLLVRGRCGYHEWLLYTVHPTPPLKHNGMAEYMVGRLITTALDNLAARYPFPSERAG